jgi:putative peptidoglycan lipid II flippase
MQHKATVTISRLFFIGVFIYSAAIIEGSILNCFRHFVYPAISVSLLSLGMIVLVLTFGGSSNINSIAYGYLLGAAAGFIIQYIKLKKIGGRLKINFTVYRGFNAKFLGLLFPVLVATSMSQANVFVDRIFASYLPDGSMSYLTYADKVTQLPIFIFSGIISTVIFPDLIQYINDNDNEKLKIYFNKAIIVSLIFLIPSLVGLAVLSREIVSLLFERNAFDSVAALNTASALIYYSPLIVLYGVMAVISKVYYSMKDTSTLMYISIGTIALNALFDYLLMKPMLHNGLALATSIVAVIHFAAAYYFLNRKINVSSGSYLLRNLIKIITASLSMGIIFTL